MLQLIGPTTKPCSMSSGWWSKWTNFWLLASWFKQTYLYYINWHTGNSTVRKGLSHFSYSTLPPIIMVHFLLAKGHLPRHLVLIWSYFCRWQWLLGKHVRHAAWLILTSPEIWPHLQCLTRQGAALHHCFFSHPSARPRGANHLNLRRSGFSSWCRIFKSSIPKEKMIPGWIPMMIGIIRL